MSGRIDTRTPPCESLAGGRRCGRTDERPTVLHPLLGIICLDHHAVPITPLSTTKEVSDVPLSPR